MVRDLIWWILSAIHTKESAFLTVMLFVKGSKVYEIKTTQKHMAAILLEENYAVELLKNLVLYVLLMPCTTVVLALHTW